MILGPSIVGVLIAQGGGQAPAGDWRRCCCSLSPQALFQDGAGQAPPGKVCELDLQTLHS